MIGPGGHRPRGEHHGQVGGRAQLGEGPRLRRLVARGECPQRLQLERVGSCLLGRRVSRPHGREGAHEGIELAEAAGARGQPAQVDDRGDEARLQDRHPVPHLPRVLRRPAANGAVVEQQFPELDPGL